MEPRETIDPREAVRLAEGLLVEARERLARADCTQAERLRRMMEDPEGQDFTLALADQAFRAPAASRAAEQFRHLLARHGIPAFLGPLERTALRLARAGSRLLPGPVMAAIRAKVRADSRRVILSAEHSHLLRHLDQRREEGARVNLNLLGEAVLGEEEAARRLERNLALLEQADTSQISVKISALFSRVDELAFDETVAAVQERLRPLYRAAASHSYRTPDGTERAKFVHLDMEEYRDLRLAVAAFRRTLDEPEFRDLSAGIVLQAYLPDSFGVQRELTRWARERVAAGGAPLKLRVVKGANLAMERVEAAERGWPRAPYASKREVDANFKRMLHYGLQPENARALRLGIASHNLFDLAWALLLRERRGSEEWSEFEMLEGMAEHQCEVLGEKTGGVLRYTPVVKGRDFLSAIAYLVRRLDENTAPGNFLRDLFGLEPGSEAWHRQEQAFLDSCRDLEAGGPATEPRRQQNRAREEAGQAGKARAFPADEPFRNEPDTDWSRPANRDWLRRHLAVGEAGESVGVDATAGDGPPAPAGPAEVDRALAVAEEAARTWGATAIGERKALLLRCAESLARNRGRAIAVMNRDADKAVREADPEVSESIDFAHYYAKSLDPLLDARGPRPPEPEALGTVVVAPPWNFPWAIPAGGVLAALMAGNAVILKPAPETVLTAWVLAQCLWEAGVPRELLQFLPCPDDDTGRALLTDDRCGAVILTGAWETARMFRQWKPDMRLFAETSGKNSLVISSAADLDLAISDLVASAFGHSGQKCSAASLAIVEADVHDSPAFQRQLRDAAASLPVGPADDLRSVVTPLVQPPGPELLRGLARLDPGERWLLRPEKIHDRLWTPGIRLGVRPGSWYHRTECFGPVLGIIRARDLDEAFRIQNDSDYGLTAGFHSLDRREIRRWTGQVEAGNAYVNRRTTGAVVRRQPFGGWKRSSVGPGAKAGGPNYVAALCRWREAGGGEGGNAAAGDGGGAGGIDRALRSYREAWEEYFSREHDPSQVLGVKNLFRYRPVSGVLYRVSGSDESDARAAERDLRLSVEAARLCGTKIEISSPHPAPSWWGELSEAPPYYREREDDFARRIRSVESDRFDRVRCPGGTSEKIVRAVAGAGLHLADAPVLDCGRLELLHYLREQTLSLCAHRYGNV